MSTYAFGPQPYVRSDYAYNPPNLIGIAIVVVVLILLFIYILIADSLYATQGLGKYVTIASSSCTNGVQTITAQCVPNSITGRGCLNEEGQQTFLNRYTVVSCQARNIASQFKVIASTECSTGNPPDICQPPNTPGTQTVTLECVQIATSGGNQCVTYSTVDYTSPSGVTAPVPQAVVYTVGETTTQVVSCTDFPNNICGNWQVVQPITYGSSTITPNDVVTNCTATDPVVVTPDCPSNGLIQIPMSCVRGNVSYTPTSSEGPSDLCLQFVSPECNTNEQPGIMCGNNPICVRRCVT